MPERDERLYLRRGLRPRVDGVALLTSTPGSTAPASPTAGRFRRGSPIPSRGILVENAEEIGRLLRLHPSRVDGLARVRLASELLASVEFDLETRDSDAWIVEVERRAQAALDGVTGDVSVSFLHHASEQVGIVDLKLEALESIWDVTKAIGDAVGAKVPWKKPVETSTDGVA